MAEWLQQVFQLYEMVAHNLEVTSLNTALSLLIRNAILNFTDHRLYTSVDGPSYLYTDHLRCTYMPVHEQYLYTYHGEIIVQLCKGHKNVLSIQCKDYYKEFVSLKYERPTASHRLDGKKCIIMLILIGLFYLRFLIKLHLKLM